MEKFIECQDINKYVEELIIKYYKTARYNCILDYEFLKTLYRQKFYEIYKESEIKEKSKLMETKF